MDKKAIIVGASSGIGKALALVLAQQGYKVGITGRRSEMLEEIKALNPNAIIPMEADATHPEAEKELDSLVTALGGLDLFVISAGMGMPNKTLDYSIENATNQLNVVAFTKMVNWGVHFFEKQGHGHLANISSVASRRGGRLTPSYNASKAYQSNYFEGVRQRFYKLKLPIHTTDIRPGFVDTAMAKGDGLFWVASPKKASAQILKAIDRQLTHVYITRRWRLVAWVLRLLPNAVYNRM